MQFTSFAFLIYLPTVFAIYWLLRNTVRLQNLFVVACSCLFYAWADWHYLFIIVGYTAVSFLSGILLERTETPWKRKLILWSIVAANIGVLGIYKYFDFFVENFNRFFLAAGVPLDWPTLNLLLPVGISFFTFQALGYTVDVYRRKIGPEHDVVAFFAFMTFFPQILAGPIERASAMLPQFLAKRRFTYTKGVEGMKYILWGLFKKMVIADNCGVVVDNVFNGYDTAEPLPLLIASVMFTFQIYCDFSGYSTIAIGCGKLLGIELSENFRLPLLSRNVKEIWSRWHITLYAWFRDYVYYPLGGSRRGMAITIVNIMIVFALSGLWHGAGWHYIFWGVYCGLGVVAYTLVQKGRGRKFLASFSPQLCVVMTFGWFVVGFVLFRCQSMSMFFSVLSGIFSTELIPPYSFDINSIAGGYIIPTLVYVTIFMIIEIITRHRPYPLSFPDIGIFAGRSGTVVKWGLLWLLAMATFLLGGAESDFIYFRF